GYVTFFNQSGYVARYQLFYFVTVNGVKIPYVIPTGDMALGNKKTLTIPGNATDIKLSGWTSTGREIFSQSYAATPKVCFKTYATIFSPQWNNNCD
ncbi:MAG: hypothetical protein H7Y12_03190, partial [Sphingobacteriaceae bacterium]|nr:hypothetical protein [Cytophagaceae bacterium]